MEQVIKKVEFANVCGYEEVKAELKNILNWFFNEELINDPKVVLPKGVLLHGRPGCGKTLIVRELKDSFNYPTIIIEGKNDNVAKEIVDAFKKAKQEKFAIVIIDEIDLLISDDDKAIRALQQELDGVNDSCNILVLATCNNINSIPDALLRPGRFDRKIAIYSPCFETRKEMFSKFLTKLGVDINNINIARVAKYCVTSASAIQAICNDAYLRHGVNMTTRDLEKSHDIVDRGNLDSDNKEYRDYMVAVHEAGHVVTTLAYSSEFDFNEATFTDYGGYTFSSYVDERKDTIEKREKELIRILAGYLAEETIFGYHDIGSYDDFNRARNLCVRFVERTCIHGLYHLIPNYENNNDRYESRVKRFINEIYTDALLRKYIRRTRKLVKKNKDNITKIADIMMEKGYFNYEDAKDLIIRT